MREIKFQFIYKCISFPCGDELVTWHKKAYSLDTLINERVPEICDLHNTCELVAERQYTGLTDKNGVEIYEGDILYWDGSIIGVVSFECCEFIVGEGVSARAMCAMPADLDIKVIGNIHENPELLGDNND